MLAISSTNCFIYVSHPDIYYFWPWLYKQYDPALLIEYSPVIKCITIAPIDDDEDFNDDDICVQKYFGSSLVKH